MGVVYSYVRFSSPGQAAGDSARRQMSGAARWAAEHGLTLDSTLRDEGLSAFRGRHRKEGAFAAFLDAVERGQVERGSVLVVESLDRLSREAIPIALEQLLSILRRGVEIVTLQDGQHYTHDGLNLSSLMLSIVSMARSHEESAVKSARVRAAWLRKKESAGEGPITRKCPAWLRLENGRWMVIEDRAETVRRIVRELAAGMGASVIAKRLNAEGIKAWGKGDGWHPSYIKKIITSETIIGVYQPMTREATGRRVADGNPVAGYYPPIIDDAIYWTARRAYEGRKNGGGRRGDHYANLFRGVAVCRQCGRPMHYINKGAAPKGSQYLSCSGALRRLCNHHTHHPYAALELAVLGGVHEIDLAAVQGGPDAVSAVRFADGVKAKLDTLTAARGRLIDAFGDEGDAQIEARIRALGEEIKTAKADLKKARADAKIAESGKDAISHHINEISDLQKRLESADAGEIFRIRAAIHQQLKNAVHRIEIGPDGWLLTLTKSFASYHLIAGRMVRVSEEILFDFLAELDE